MSASFLIPALATAYRTLLQSATTTNDCTYAAPHLDATAKSIEKSLTTLLKQMDKTTLTQSARVAIMNAGSLKLLTLLPITETPIKGSYGNAGPDVAFIVAQPKAYIQAALKRGMQLDTYQQFSLVQKIGESDANSTFESLIGNEPITALFAHQALALYLKADALARKRLAPIVEKLWKSAHKHNPEAMTKTLESFCILHDPALAGPHVYAAITAHALFGTKLTSKDCFEHRDIAQAVTTLFSTKERSAAKAEAGSFKEWLDKGCNVATPLQPLDRVRQHYRAPVSRLRW